MSADGRLKRCFCFVSSIGRPSLVLCILNAAVGMGVKLLLTCLEKARYICIAAADAGINQAEVGSTLAASTVESNLHP